MSVPADDMRLAYVYVMMVEPVLCIDCGIGPYIAIAYLCSSPLVSSKIWMVLSLPPLKQEWAVSKYICI